MNLSGPFIRRPVMTILLTLGLLIFGTVAYRSLPVSELPNVDFPTILVQAALPGADPETMAASVATPLERQFSTIAGITEMSSSSGLGSTQISLQFDLSRDIDAAAQDVQAAISRAQAELPTTMPAPPSFLKVNPAMMPILFIAVTSPTMPLYDLDDLARTRLAQRISTISGVAQVQVFGSQKYAVRVRVDPRQLAARGVGLGDLAQAIDAANSNLPVGTLQGPHQTLTLQSNGGLLRAAGYGPIIVAYQNGRPVRLDELGEAIDSVENDQTAAWYNGQRALVLAVQRQPGTNTVAVANAVRAVLPTFRAELPASVALHIVYDRAETIRASVHDVKRTLVITLVLVVLVIFVFLRNAAATAIASLALPMSIVGTFAAMALLGFSLDNLSLLALTLSVGFVVDDAIVVLENIFRHHEQGGGRMAAALTGSAEIGFTILSMTLSLAAVFIPVLFLGGLMGRLFHEFAVVIAIAILISGVVSLTLTPMLSSRYLRHRPPPAVLARGAQPESLPPDRQPWHRRLAGRSQRAIAWMVSFYDRTLRIVLRHRLATMATVVLVMVGTIVLFGAIPKGFVPSEDTGQVYVPSEVPEGTSWEALSQRQQALAAIVGADPNVEAYVSTAGSVGGLTANSGVIFARLKPRAQRDLSADEVVTQLRRKLAAVPGIRAYPQNPAIIRTSGTLTKAEYAYTMQSGDLDALVTYAPQVEQAVRQLPGLRDVNSDLKMKNPQVSVVVDRDKAATLGVSAEAVDEALSYAFASREVSTIYAPTDTYKVMLELLPELRATQQALDLIHVRSSSGQQIPVGTLAAIQRTVGPLTVNHAGQLPAVTLSFNLAPGTSLGSAVAAVNAKARGILPGTITTRFQGTAQQFQASMRGLGVLLLLAVLVIYLVLGILYESFLHPITILSALPFAGFGALLALALTRVELSVYAFVGVIMLVGLVKKNGIMMVDFAVEARRRGLAIDDAILEACRVRFRPIMMTTMAALLGTLPIALATGTGAEARRPLGISVVGGLLFSQLLTLYVTPVFYVYLERLQDWRVRRRARGPEKPAEAPT